MLTRKCLKSPRVRLISILILLSLIMSGCSFVRIQNVSNIDARVLVRVPDNSRGYTRFIRSGNIVDVFSGHGGRYTITLLPNEQYLELLNGVKQHISQRLFNERATLTGNEVARLVERLNEIGELITQQSSINVSCTGSLPDFDTVVVTIAFDSINNSWEFICQ